MRDLKEMLREFIEKRGYPSCFETKAGEQCQGYIEAIEGDEILFYASGPMVDNDLQMRYLISEIDLGTLSHWDWEKKEWVYFHQDSEREAR